MNTMQLLIEEHDIIKRVLQSLEKIATDCEQKKRLRGDLAERAIDFFRRFADHCHHGKEEDQLFPLLKRKKGFAGGCSPVVVLDRLPLTQRKPAQAASAA